MGYPPRQPRAAHCFKKPLGFEGLWISTVVVFQRKERRGPQYRIRSRVRPVGAGAGGPGPPKRKLLPFFFRGSGKRLAETRQPRLAFF